MTTAFKSIPEGHVTLANVTVPGCLMSADKDLVTTDISFENGTLTHTPGQRVDMARAIVFPCFTDMHTHLDKGHIWPRAANSDGTFMGALTTVGADRAANWTAEDVAARMEFSLRSAYAHGTRAIRTHLDSIPPQDRISWPVFTEKRAEWAGRIELQAASLIGCDSFENIARDYATTADIVAEHGGTLGMVTYPVPDVVERIRDLFDLAGARDLEADFHSDETMDPGAETLRSIAEIVLETGWSKPVTVGHCCSLSSQDEARALDTLDLVAKAGINIVSLPMCNLYLQDRGARRTPRGRGITLVHEMKARGINVSFASDNTRDPFYAYGDMDMIEVMRQATRIGHLDHADTDWTNAFTANPTKACNFAPGSLVPGAPADLVICNARDWTELFSRPQADRIVLRGGRAIDTTLPAYATLDHLMETA
ncbi:MAG: cytosine deaminase [Pseudomonadota bacterium]